MQKVNIIKLENDIKQFIHRYVKEKLNNNSKLSANDKYYHVVELRDCIIKYLKYTYKITDVIVDDIIALICKKGYMRLSTLTSDINEHIKKNRKSETIKTSFKTNEERMVYIKDYMKKNITPFGILAKPINHMFHWASTKSGYTFMPH